MSDMFNINSMIPYYDNKNKKILQNNNINCIKRVLDAYQYNYNEFRKCKEQILNNNKPWNFYNVRMDFFRRLIKNSDGYFEIPIFTTLHPKLFKNSHF